MVVILTFVNFGFSKVIEYYCLFKLLDLLEGFKSLLFKDLCRNMEIEVVNSDGVDKSKQV